MTNFKDFENDCKEMLDKIEFLDMSIRCGNDGRFSDNENKTLSNLNAMSITIKKYLGVLK